MSISNESDWAMIHQERLEIGEKWFVCSVMATLATEAGLTVISCGMHFSWPGFLLGVFGFCFMMFLANRLYKGDQPIRKIALAWVAFEILYAALALYLMVSGSQGAETARSIGAPAAWPVIFKGLVYLFFGWVLVRMPAVRDFFAEKRGEYKDHDLGLAAPVPEPVTPVEFSAAQKSGLVGLAWYLPRSVAALVALGAMQILLSVLIYNVTMASPLGAAFLAQGILTIILGLALAGPANEIRPMTNAEDQTQEQLTAALGSLVIFFKTQILIGLLMAVVVAAKVYFYLAMK